MDSNIKDNVEPVTWTTIETPDRVLVIRGVDLISDVLPFGRLWYAGPGAVSNAVGYAIP